MIEVDELASPLPAARVDAAAPLGTLFGAADSPLSTPTAALLIDVIEAVRARPVVALAWSAPQPAYAASFPDLVPAPLGVDPQTAAPITDRGAVAHAHVGAVIGGARVAPVRAALPIRDVGWWSQHERVAVGAPLPGSPACVPVGPAPTGGTFLSLDAVTVWARDAVVGDVASWQEEP